MTVWYVTVWLSVQVWGCKTWWHCDSVAMWLCYCVLVWICDGVNIWLCFCVSVLKYNFVTSVIIGLSDILIEWLCDLVTVSVGLCEYVSNLCWTVGMCYLVIVCPCQSLTVWLLTVWLYEFVGCGCDWVLCGYVKVWLCDFMYDSERFCDCMMVSHCICVTVWWC